LKTTDGSGAVVFDVSDTGRGVSGRYGDRQGRSQTGSPSRRSRPSGIGSSWRGAARDGPREASQEVGGEIRTRKSRGSTTAPAFVAYRLKSVGYLSLGPPKPTAGQRQSQTVAPCGLRLPPRSGPKLVHISYTDGAERGNTGRETIRPIARIYAVFRDGAIRHDTGGRASQAECRGFESHHPLPRKPIKSTKMATRVQ